MGKEWHCWSWPYDLKPDDLLTLKIAKKKKKKWKKIIHVIMAKIFIFVKLISSEGIQSWYMYIYILLLYIMYYTLLLYIIVIIHIIIYYVYITINMYYIYILYIVKNLRQKQVKLKQ